MRYAFLLLLLTGCVDQEIKTYFKIAQSNPDYKACFNAKTDDKEINGRFCLTYEGPIDE